MIGVQICALPMPNRTLSDESVSGLRIKTEHLQRVHSTSRYSRRFRSSEAVLTPREFSAGPYTPNTGHTFGVPNQFISTPLTAVPRPIVVHRRADSAVLRAQREQRYRRSYEALKSALKNPERARRESLVLALESAAAYMKSVVDDTKERLQDLRVQLADGAEFDGQTVAQIQRERWMAERRCSRLEDDEHVVEEKVHTLKTNLHVYPYADGTTTAHESRQRKNLSMFFERSPTKICTTSRPRSLEPIRLDDTPRVRTVKDLSSPTRLRPLSPRTLWKSNPLPDILIPRKTSDTLSASHDTTKTRPLSQRWSRLGNAHATRGRSYTASTASESVLSTWDDDRLPQDMRSGTAIIYKPLKLTERNIHPLLRRLSGSLAAEYINQDPVHIPEYVWDLLNDFDMVGEELIFASDRDPPPSPTLPQFAEPRHRGRYLETRYSVTPSESDFPAWSRAQPEPPVSPSPGHARRRTTAFSLTRWTALPPSSSPAPSLHPPRPPPALQLHLESPTAARRRSQSHPLPLSPNMLYAIPESPSSNPGMSPPPVSASVGSQRSGRSHRIRAKSLFRLGHVERPEDLGPDENSKSEETLFIQATAPERDPFAMSTPGPSPYSSCSAQEGSTSSQDRARRASEPLGRTGSMVDRIRKRLHVFK
ncbi:hypothetical protein OE88DRAFT_1809223 [Heliocybe sulcata]|uniref:Uncharacterized protein n=1 Tax=Heliocybe sulcata TaxID=5364 RepID=A0A5C3N1A2_9AGAM|nr:hypothetical protein OE88DRAFT_1809223 [Heliocybe sulcata]